MKRALKFISIGLLLLAIGVGGYTIYMVQAVKETMSNIYEPMEPLQPLQVTPLPNNVEAAEDKPSQHPDSIEVSVQKTVATDDKEASILSTKGVTGIKPVDLSKQEPFTLLFMGVDERTADRGRSDSIIVLGVNPAKHSVLMFNIPRDTRTKMVGKGTQDKINHAYAFGNVNMMVDTVENFLNIPINYYVKVNMEGFARIIDILGGVKVDNAYEFTYEGVTYPQGAISLDGEQALRYSRMRHDDPNGDLGRNVRQQNILAELIGRARNVSSIGKLPDVLKQIEANTKTNLTMDDTIQLYNHYRKEIEVIEKDKVEGSGQMINDIYYYMVSEQERQRIHNRMVKQLEP